jgi:hypothetical protein
MAACSTVMRRPARSWPVVFGTVLALALSGLASAALPAAAATDAELRATLQLQRGEIDFDLEPDVLQSFDEEGVPFFIQVFDGCAINGHYWVFAAGLGSEAVPLEVADDRSEQSFRSVLPAYVPGEPIATVFEPDALAICRDAPTGGLPEVGVTAAYTTVTPRCGDGSDRLVLLSGGASDSFREVVRDGSANDVVFSQDPIAIRDRSPEVDELFLLAEGRTPGLVEGVRFSGEQGMLPGNATLERAVKGLTRARVRRAFEAAKTQLVPDQLIETLGLRRVECIFHVALNVDSVGGSAYLAEAGWIRDGGPAVKPPQLVEPRFDVQLRHADGTSEVLAPTGPWQGSPGEGVYWEHATDGAMVRIIDGCALGGAFWTVAAAVTDEPLELVVTDRRTGNTLQQVLWTDREDVSRLADTAGLACL